MENIETVKILTF